MSATATIIRCIGQNPDCPRCHTEPLRGAERHVCDELCQLLHEVRQDPAAHQRSHQPKRHDCGALLDDRQGTNYERVQFCGWGTCVQFLCPGCEGFVYGYGPAGCQCEAQPCGHGTYDEIVTPAPTRRPARRFPFLRRRA